MGAGLLSIVSGLLLGGELVVVPVVGGMLVAVGAVGASVVVTADVVDVVADAGSSGAQLQAAIPMSKAKEASRWVGRPEGTAPSRRRRRRVSRRERAPAR
jgi:hypothetical protein